MRFPLVVGLSFAVAIGALACGGAPKPDPQVPDPARAIGEAQGAGASTDPKAALHLKLAQEEKDQADKLKKDGDDNGASFMMMRAQADADLAAALARLAAGQADVQKTQEQVQELKKRAQAAQ